jgi:para-nitrobenzyl esterase
MKTCANRPDVITRRALVRSALLMGVGLGVEPWSARASTSREAIAETTYGRVRGVTQDGINVFKGIPYGASTASANRFRPPQRPMVWGGVRDALHYGPIAVQDPDSPPSDPEMRNLQQSTAPQETLQRSEDCLVLNVWTRRIADGGKRPVMVWCHGGGFDVGKGNTRSTDGTHLVREYDVVVVSFNHRLTAFGFLYLGDRGGERYADSGNVGMLDIVAVLRWVRDNIAEFGGDPGCVTVFGCSGGGQKVSTLMAMPGAKGLFHRAIIESGSICRVMSREDSARVTHEVLSELDLQSAPVERLQQVPADAFLDASRKVDSTHIRNGKLIAERQIYMPVVDGRSLLRDPFDPNAPLESAEVPLIVGCTVDEETNMGLKHPYLFSLTSAELPTQARRLGIPEERVDGMIAAFRATRPGDSPSEIFFAMARERYERNSAILQAERKSALGRAPAYMYLYAWKTPSERYKAMHCEQVTFEWANLDLAPGFRGATPDPRLYELERNTSAAWAAFARTGNPSHPGIPQWKAYTIQERATMVFDYACQLVNDPLREDRIAMAPLGPGPQG